MDTHRLVRIFAGTFVLVSLALGAPGSPLFVDAHWLWLTTFVGANLFQSGFTRFCPLEIVLKRLGVREASDPMTQGVSTKSRRSLSPALRALRADIPDTMKGFDAMAAAAMRDGALRREDQGIDRARAGGRRALRRLPRLPRKGAGEARRDPGGGRGNARRRGLHGWRTFAHVRRGRAGGLRGNGDAGFITPIGVLSQTRSSRRDVATRRERPVGGVRGTIRFFQQKQRHARQPLFHLPR